jgi:hypothetical protein
MKIKAVNQVPEDTLRTEDFDIIIASSGFEKRSTHLLTKYTLNSDIKLTLGFKTNDRVLNRPKNDLFFREQKFKIFPVEGGDDLAILSLMKEFIQRTGVHTLNILIDYSCMTRTWYAAMLSYFRFIEKNISSVNLYFCYSIAAFTPAAEDQSKNLDVSPIKGYNNITIPNLPTALIIGLGYIEQRALGLTEYLDAVPFIFYTDSTDDNKYSMEVEKNNHLLLSNINRENVFKYPIHDLNYSFHLLRDLCKDIKSDYRLILAPCGPKPFSLLCLLTSITLEDIDVWRVSAGDFARPVDKIAEGPILILKVTFVNS